MSDGVNRRGIFRIAAAGCALLAVGARARAQTRLKLTLDGRIDVQAAPFFVAQEQGHFKSEGVDVSVEPSPGGTETFTRVASGAFDIGVGDINTLIRYRDQNSSAPLKAVFVVNNRPSYAVIGRKSRGIEAPADLADKRIGTPAAEPASAAWTAFARVNGIDLSNVRAVSLGLAVREPMLAAGEVDAVTGSSYSTPITLREKGVPAEDITTLLMADYGVVLYGASIFVSAKTLAEKPDAVRGFLRAVTAGLKETLRDPAAAVAAVMRRGNGGNPSIELERLTILLRDSILTPVVRAEGLGEMNAARFDAAIEQIATGYTFKSKPKLDDVFDPSFLPAESERRLE